MDEIHKATFTTEKGSKLTDKDIEDICNKVSNGTHLYKIRNEYNIGTNRLYYILDICGIKYGGNYRRGNVSNNSTKPIINDSKSDDLVNDVMQQLAHTDHLLDKSKKKRLNRKI